MLCVDPEITSINVADITETNATVSWSRGQTQVVSSSLVYHTVSGSTNWVSSPASGSSTTHTVSGLQPGTQYQFYVTITSYGKSSTSDTVTVTTGKMQLLCIDCRLVGNDRMNCVQQNSHLIIILLLTI